MRLLGPEVAQYAAQQFHIHLQSMMSKKSAEDDELVLPALLKKAFLTFDSSLLTDDALSRLLELRELEAAIHQPESGAGDGRQGAEVEGEDG